MGSVKQLAVLSLISVILAGNLQHAWGQGEGPCAGAANLYQIQHVWAGLVLTVPTPEVAGSQVTAANNELTPFQDNQAFCLLPGVNNYTVIALSSPYDRILTAKASCSNGAKVFVRSRKAVCTGKQLWRVDVANTDKIYTAMPTGFALTNPDGNGAPVVMESPVADDYRQSFRFLPIQPRTPYWWARG